MKFKNTQAKGHVSSLLMAIVFVAALAVPNMLFAQTFEGADQRVCGFFDDLVGLLNMASIAVVTEAVIFAGAAWLLGGEGGRYLRRLSDRFRP